MKRLFSIGCLMVLGMLFGFKAVGQASDFRFNHLTQKEGLPGKLITSILKDRKGNLWIGCYDGLFRYDGTHFTRFRKSKEPASLSSNNVLALCEDLKGNIWGATSVGIFCYTPSLNRFKNYSTINIGIGPGVENIVCDASGNIWAGGIPGLLKFNVKGDSLEHLKADTNGTNSITVDRIRSNCMMTDASGHGLWIATRDGLNYLDTRTGRFMNHRNQPVSYLFNRHHIRALARSPQGHYWMFDNNTRSIIGFLPGRKDPLYKIDIGTHLPNPFGGTLFEDSQHRLWYSDLESEILMIDYLKGNLVEKISHQPGNPFSIGSNFFWKAFEDEDGTIWFGTLTDISTINANRNFYKYHPISETIPELREKFAISNLAQNPSDSTWWMATQQGNAIHYYPNSGKHEVIKLSRARPQANGLMPGTFLKTSFLGKQVIFHTDNGSWQWAPGNAVPQPFNLLPPKYANYQVHEMTRAGKNEYWLTNRKSLVYWNTLTNETKEFFPPGALRNNNNGQVIFTLHADNRGKLWMVLHSHGFGWVDTLQQQIIAEPFNMPEEKKRSSYFTDFSLDAAGDLWFGYIGQGLYKYEVKSKKFTWWDETNNLGTNQISTATIDGLGQVWCFRHNQVSVFVPGSNSFYEFSLPFGNADISYTNFATRLENGHILANIAGDLVEFFPEKIVAVPAPMAPAISMVDISGKTKLLFDETSLSLRADENFLTFRFGTLTDRQLFPYTITYKMEGVDPDWRTVGASGEASYTQLPSGNFTFRVVVEGKNKAWKSPETILKIHISTPFYKTTWFRLGAILLLSGLLYAWYRERMRQQAKLFEVEGRAQMLQKEKTLVQYENLKQHLNPHFLFNSLSSLSSLIEIDPKMAGKFLGSLSKIYRYILQSKDKDTVPLKDEINFVRWFIALQQTRFNQGLQVNIDVNEEDLQKHIVPVTLQNLIENAIKHNIIDDENILVVDIVTGADYLVVKNRMQLKKYVETSNQQGLENLRNLYTYLTNRPLEYRAEGDFFVVKIPLV